MNQLNLILENVRLSHIEKLLQESQTQDELQRGIVLINESMQAVLTLLQEDGWTGFSNMDNSWFGDTKSNKTTGSILNKPHDSSIIQPEHIPGETKSSSMAKPLIKQKSLLKESEVERFMFTKQLVEEAFKLDNQAKLQTFARRGIKATNPGLTPDIGVLPYGGAIIGGAIGNQIHGEDGFEPNTGIMYNAQANNDDEYDVTGALLGGATGLYLAGKKSMGNSKAVADRIQRDGYRLSPQEKDQLKTGAAYAQVFNTRRNNPDLYK
jgi:hypothetical protein